MLIRRCSWHAKYHGYRLWLGVKRWGGWRVGFTDGMCQGCRRRFAAELKQHTAQRKAAK